MTADVRGLDPLAVEGLSVVPRLENDVLHIAVLGAVEMREPGDVLNPYWNRIDDEIRRRALKRVEVDLRDLNFMNSSGILTLVRWITKAKSHSGGDAYQMILRYDRNVTWQRSSVPTLAKLAPNVVQTAEING
jgi:hypothetical protein